MKLIQSTLIILASLAVVSQTRVQTKMSWITDANFEAKVSGTSKFGDKDDIVVVEFWADFNKANSFGDWGSLDVPYYRIDIAHAPVAKKKYRVRMAPTIIIFKDGSKEVVFKAGLDLELPTDLKEINEAIKELQKASAFE